MRRVKLDRIDRRILRDLQDDGRITNVELARRAGISAPPCLRRVRALEDAGYIRGYHADVDPDLVAFEDLIAAWPEVRECHMLAGETDFLLKIVADDWDTYNRFLTSKLTAAPNVSHVKSALAIRLSKQNFGVPIDVDGAPVGRDA
jgi:DNA-binding Lrp family transcriptional regulator